MDQKIRCQSCGMPLGSGFFGTEKDGSLTQEYCKFCYQNGAYTNPQQTLQEMIESSVTNMVEEVKIPEEKAQALAKEFIPKLKRWQH